MCCEHVPGISVIMGTRYRRPDISLLRRSVESILEQTYQDFEFLICDDGSTTAAKALLERIVSEDRRVRLVQDPGCLDLASKLNLCLAYARGNFIARMDDDDRSCPDRLEKELAYLKADQGAAFVGCNVALIQEEKKIGERHLPERPKVEDFYLTQPYIHPALLFRREALEAVGGYSESRDCVLCEDYDLLLRLYQTGFAGANLRVCLLDYTVPSDPKGGRKMGHRINEMKTRYRRFKELGRLPGALPYVIKPIAVGLVPGPLLGAVKRKYTQERNRDNGDRAKAGE